MWYPRTFVILVGLASTACGKDGPSQPQPDPLAITALGATPDRDSAVVITQLTAAAAVRFAYVPVGESDTTIVERFFPAGVSKLVIRPLRYSQAYYLKATAIRSGQAPATSFFNFVSDTQLNPCSPRPTELVPTVALNFEFRPQPNPDEGVYLAFVEGLNCDGTPFTDNLGAFFSLDNGHSIKIPFKAKPSRPYGHASLSIRVGLFRPVSGFVRWLEPSDFTLNGKNPTRVTEQRPAPPTCIPDAGCKPGRGVVFDLDVSGVVDP